MSSVQDLINAIEAGRTRECETAFESLIHAKIAERMEERRAEIRANMFESVELDKEQLDELSKSTLGSYAKKAMASASGLATNAMHHKATEKQWRDKGEDKKADTFSKYSFDATEKQIKREAGAAKAIDRLTKESEELGEGFFSKKTSGKKQPENFTAFYSADDKMEAGEAKEKFYKELKKRFPNAKEVKGGHGSVSWMENGKKVYGDDTSWMVKDKLVAGSHVDKDGDRNWFLYESEDLDESSMATKDLEAMHALHSHNAEKHSDAGVRKSSAEAATKIADILKKRQADKAAKSMHPNSPA
jgi:hypothetical protein